MRIAALIACTAVAVLAVATPSASLAADAAGGAAYGGIQARQSQPATPAAPAAPGGTPAAPAPAADAVARINPDGTATPPEGAPSEVVALFEAANRIATLPYRYGGGHRDFVTLDRGYDCSGSVSYALNGARQLEAPLDSTGLSKWGERGPGAWITVYANRGHTFLVVAGVRFDTSGQRVAGTRWQPAARSVKGFVVRHPEGL